MGIRNCGQAPHSAKVIHREQLTHPEGTGLETALCGRLPLSSISVFSARIEVILGVAMVSRGKGMAAIPDGCVCGLSCASMDPGKGQMPERASLSAGQVSMSWVKIKREPRFRMGNS